ncbi:Sjogren's syndrome/scleroderma autoantigen 1 family protein [Candidatus Lokiarchaeum ossiferum]|uniref:Sjogren's syndrome/scleroderma autoantigen 1 family protein n=1 Tax=Candidatus Lokiarchaeum ossiferum TaxID=2951803 RepID=UPI00352CBB28
MNSDRIVKDMAKLLRNGATMLDKECPKCGKILFRLKTGTIFCPNCSDTIKSSTNIERNSVAIHSKENENSKDSGYFYDLNNIFSNLILKLSKKLDNLDDSVSIAQILKNINSSLEIISKLKNLKNLERDF